MRLVAARPCASLWLKPYANAHHFGSNARDKKPGGEVAKPHAGFLDFNLEGRFAEPSAFSRQPEIDG
jgi:hypothetical protein